MENLADSQEVFGIQELILILLELLLLMQQFIQNLMLLNLIVHQLVLFPDVVGASGLGQTVYFEHEVGTDQLNPDNTVTTLTSFATSF